ncbi:hypothetical protein GLOTRDRAFT_140481 [Gloeophyllum trabeum ATCC 11539]|uniref:F-box domain-containing protein n=1 Tax=Gloeophyllum trabeum (strain ATCC 11539 / FP-39264 / Madison 617) TaxID=670483 RepID=S7PXI8_GLOTA|nr:uncharacterized protein GLOTRDRAFT_140481 [Gloeophyllum trabeum ATCC 11539]EPQ52002.1 hypothetical protein GLOTRDRAFT_140481 [Gloeophyllum trabeum ATCC 11539]
MHSLLCSQDILSQVFGQLVNELDNIRDGEEERNEIQKSLLRGTMLHAALTCRTMQEPALDALWRILDSLHPIFRLVNGFGSVHGNFTLIKGVTEEELQRVRKYSGRVRKLFYVGYYEPIHPVAYLRLAQALGSPILPLLRDLTWSSRDVGLQLPSLVTSTLVNVNIRLFISEDDDDDDEDRFKLAHSVTQTQALQIVVEDLADKVPHIQELVLENFRPGVSLYTVRNFTRLRSLRIATDVYWQSYNAFVSISYSDLLALSQMGSLSELSANVDDTDVLTTSRALSFRSLRVLKLTGHLSKVIAVLKLVQSIPLQRIDVCLGGGDAPQHDWYQNFFRCISLPSLRHLFVEFTYDLQKQNVRAGVVLDVRTIIPPLLVCAQLTHFEIELSSHAEQRVLMDDDDLLQMAQAWPHLEYFCWNFAYDISRIPTVRGLHAFAAHCPRLRTLMIALNGNVPFPEANKAPDSQHDLKRLVAYGPDLGEITDTAQWVYALFPSVEDIMERGKWPQVLKIVQAFRRMRAVHG